MGLLDDFRQLVASTVRHVRLLGPVGFVRSGLMVYQELLVDRGPHAFDRFEGEPIFERDWDLMIVLDGCRVDLLAGVADEYDFLRTVDRTTSVAGHSAGWMDATFDDAYADEMADTAYVTANPHTDAHLRDEQFAALEEVWRYAWDDDVGTVPPRALTDTVIDLARRDAADRYLVHYMQPHFPSIPRPDLGSAIERDADGWPDSIWERLKEGEVDQASVWDAYEANLRYVLDEVELLLENVDADRVVVTADHGNAAGEYGFYGHGDYIPLRAVRDVPWVETTAVDGGGHVPDPDHERSDDVPDVEDRLAALGYKE